MKTTLPSLMLSALLCATPSLVFSADLHVRLDGVENDEGELFLQLYDDPEGFREPEKARQVLSLAATPGNVEGVFSDLPSGRYAIIAFHDENGDGEMNRFLGMIPTEGYGLSNNPKVMGPPKFEESAFDLPEAGKTIEIRLNY